MRSNFDNALKSRNLFPSQFEKVVASYEAEHGLESTGLTRGRIKAVLFGNNKSVPKVIWNRIWEVLAIVPTPSQEGGEGRPVTRIVQVLDIEDRDGQPKPGKVIPTVLIVDACIVS